MKAYDFVKEYIEDKGINYGSRTEYEEVSTGIRHFLEECGFSENDESSYSKVFVGNLLKKIDAGDLKEYFINYKMISRIREIVIATRTDKLTKEEQEELQNCYDVLAATKLGTKYIPADEISGLLFS